MDYLNYIKENSKKLLSEDLKIADTDEIVSKIIEQKYYSSLPYQVCEIAPVHGPTAAAFALTYVDDPAFPGKKKVKSIRQEVEVEDDSIEDTGFTEEAIQDLQNIFGKPANEIIAKIFAGVSAMNESIKLIQKLDEFSVFSSSLTLSDPGNAETILFEVQQKISELILQINSNSFKSLESFAILPSKIAAAYMSNLGELNGENNSAGLFIGKKSKTKFYLNPINTSNTVYVGIKSDIPGLSSVIFSPYHHVIKVSTHPETGQKHVFNFNRYAITENALSASNPSEKMLYKFDVS